MFEIFTNSIVHPKNIVNYHNKKGGFVFLYILLLIVLMSMATFVYFISTTPPKITEANTGCEIVNNTLVCTGENYDVNNSFELYDFEIHFLAETNQISDITNRDVLSIIVQGSKLSVFIGDRTVNSIDFLNTYDINSLDDVVSILKTSVIVAGILIGLLSNTFIILFIILVSTIPFMRFKKFISYKKIFKMLAFAATPMAFLFAIYNLVNFDMIIFFILMLFAYRSVFTLQRELQFRILSRPDVQSSMKDQGINKDNIVDQDDFDEEEPDDDNNIVEDDDDDNNPE